MHFPKRLLFALPLAGLAAWVVYAQVQSQQTNEVHFHHFHLNVVDPQKSVDFYQRIFGAVPVKFAGRADSLFTERSFILLNKVAAPAAPDIDTAIWHLGWSGVDMPNEFTNLKAKGVQFQSTLTPLANNFYMYAYGPDKEVLEICCGGGNHLYNHIHMLSRDPEKAVHWYADNLGIPLRAATKALVPQPTPPGAPPLPVIDAGISGLRVDNVGMIIFQQQDKEPHNPLWTSKLVPAIQPSEGRVVDHLAFSYRHIQPIFEKLQKAGVPIVDPIAVRPEYGFRSFFILGPDRLLIEIVEAKPIPDASWEIE